MAGAAGARERVAFSAAFRRPWKRAVPASPPARAPTPPPKMSSCTVAATNGVFGDPCGGTYKYLTVDYECISPASLAVLPPPPPPVGPPEVFAEYDAIEMNVCYQLKARDFDVVMHEEPGDGSCSDGDPIYAQTSGRADSFRFVPALCTDGGILSLSP